MRTQQDKKKLSLYVTDSEKALLDKLSETWGCSNNQAVIRAIKIATNTPIDTLEAIPTDTSTHTVNIGLSKEDIELLIEERVELLVYEKIELLVNSRIELLENQGEENAKKFSEISDRILKIENEIDDLKTPVGNDDPDPSPEDGLQNKQLDALLNAQGVKCRPEHISRYLTKKGYVPPEVTEILDQNWIKKGKYWYPKQETS